ncbi:hypothetical protein BH23CHL8_BH23CHL8_24980 [soil metagenome]
MAGHGVRGWKETVMAKVGAHPGGVVLVVALLAALAMPTLAQEYQEYERPPIEDPVRGYQRGDGLTVLDDRGFCSYLLGATLGDDRLTFRSLIDRSRQQRRAKRAAFLPLADEPTLERCVEVLNAFRVEPGEEDTLPTWAREQPVVPEALAGFLPADPVSHPLATPPPIGDGARTTGFGSRVSTPFVLWGGNYYVEPDVAACETWTGTIRGLGDPSVVAASVDGATNLYAVPMGNYYWDVTASECDWSVDLVTVAPVPDPTPTPRPMATVPSLVGTGQFVPNSENPEWLTAEQARDAIAAAGLVVGTCTEQFQFPHPPGRVLRQDPPGGTVVELGSAVDVVVRDGSGGCQVLLTPV